MAYKVAVVGATGNVGREMLSVLAERQFPAERSGGAGLDPLRWAPKSRSATAPEDQALDYFDFKGTDICSDVGGRRHLQGMGAQDRAPRAPS